MACGSEAVRGCGGKEPASDRVPDRGGPQSQFLPLICTSLEKDEALSGEASTKTLREGDPELVCHL